MVQWLALWPHCQNIPSLSSGWTQGAFLCGICMFSLYLRGFQTHTLVSSHSKKNMHFDLNSDNNNCLYELIMFALRWLSPVCTTLGTFRGKHTEDERITKSQMSSLYLFSLNEFRCVSNFSTKKLQLVWGHKSPVKTNEKVID